MGIGLIEILGAAGLACRSIFSLKQGSRLVKAQGHERAPARCQRKNSQIRKSHISTHFGGEPGLD
jgi:hypothetical protein